jgi:hypothetical protein
MIFAKGCIWLIYRTIIYKYYIAKNYIFRNVRFIFYVKRTVPIPILATFQSCDFCLFVENVIILCLFLFSGSEMQFCSLLKIC